MPCVRKIRYNWLDIVHNPKIKYALTGLILQLHYRIAKPLEKFPEMVYHIHAGNARTVCACVLLPDF